MKFIVRIDNQSFEVEIDNINERPIVAVVDGKTYEVWPDNEMNGALQNGPALEKQQVIARPEATGSVPSGTGRNIKVVRAPIPGVILNVQVKTGDIVEIGQALFTIEAMKMRNLIRASRTGEIGGSYSLSQSKPTRGPVWDSQETRF